MIKSLIILQYEMSSILFLFLFVFYFLGRVWKVNKAAEQKKIKSHMVGRLKLVKLSRLSFKQRPGEILRLLNAWWNLLSCNSPVQVPHTFFFLFFYVCCWDSKNSLDERNVMTHSLSTVLTSCSNWFSFCFYNKKTRRF